MEDTAKAKGGFASMSPEKRREIARMGGKSVPAEKRSFSQNSDLAMSAGRKGGQSVEPGNRSFTRNPALAAKAGSKGGKTSRRVYAPDEDK